MISPAKYIKFGLSEKHTKFFAIFLMLMRKIFSNFVFFSESPNFILLRNGARSENLGGQ